MAIIPFRKNPIAWLQLRYQKAQTTAAILGITFTTILLFMQIGFRSGFLVTFIDIPNHLRGDLIIVNTSIETILRPPAFSQRRLYQALAFDEVQSVTPVYVSELAMRDPSGKPEFLRPIALLSFPVVDSPLDIPAVDANLEALKRSNVFLFDERSRPEFLPIIERIRQDGHQSIEVRSGARQVRVSVEGLFPLGANATYDAHMLSSDRTLFALSGRDRNLINIGLVTLKPGVDAGEMAARLADYLPPDVLVFDKAALIDAELDFYEHGTPVGTIFRFGLGGAIVIGIVILYQILFQIVSKYTRDYATLKAIGFSQGMLRLIVLRGALLLALIGFIPGFIASVFMYQTLTTTTSLRFTMTPGIVAVVFAAVCLICLLSAALAIRKLRDADPADLFG